MSIKDQIRAEIDKLYGEYKDKFHQSGDQYHLGLIDGLDMAERVLDSLPEQPVEGLEEEIKRMVYDVVYDLDGPAIKGTSEYLSVEDVAFIARHFAEWGARHSINWGDVQLLDTFILELSREEKDGTDWGDSEKFYTEVLRRFHEFNDKNISEIVAEWGAEHARKEDK